jgi:hypothetical protein
MRMLLAFLMSVLFGLTEVGFAQREIPMSSEKGTLTLIFNGLVPDVARADPFGDVVRLQASIRNDTTFKFRSVIFAMYGYDANGHDVWLCGRPGISADGGCEFALSDSIEPGQTVAVKSPGDLFVINRSRNPARADFRIKAAPYFIKYDIQAEPVVNDKFAISPTFGIKGIGLEFRNKSSDVIEVAWDQSVYIDDDGNSSRLIRGNVNLAEKDRPQPNTVIPPGAKLQETVFPIDRIQQEDGKWTQLPILPDVAYIFDEQFLSEVKWAQHVYLPGTKQLAGKELRVFLRLLVNDQKQNVTLTFKIASMIQ